MEILFKGLKFRVTDGVVDFVCGFGADNSEEKHIKKLGTTEVHINGRNHQISGSHKMFSSSEKPSLLYKSHTLENDLLTIVEQNDTVEVTTVYESIGDAIRVHREIKNISDDEILLDWANSMMLFFGTDVMKESKDIYLHTFTNFRYSEALPKVESLDDLGFCFINASHRVYNMGSWSTKDLLPQAVIEDKTTGNCIMFQIESNNNWYYEIGVTRNRFYLTMMGATQRFHQWNKLLKAGDVYVTPAVSITNGKSLNDVFAKMTGYRRKIKGTCKSDAHLPAIFNEYMHLSWDSPDAQRTKEIAPTVAKMGCEYYVIDCGWHDEVDGSKIYPYVGAWKESNARFPKGVRETADFLDTLGLKLGLWIEPEIIGQKCDEMLAFYDDDCFLTRNGKKVAEMGRYFLDYRHPKVRARMTDVIDRMVDDYGAKYIKFDYNQDTGAGTELDACSLGDGLERHADAFLSWVCEQMARHPEVVFEACASGGQRMDYKTLSRFPLCSTSDQTRYNHYPYIVGNILTAVIPEQAAVWSYPVDMWVYDKENEQNSNANISKERVVINMMNALLGRIHLASRINLLDEQKQALIKEGIDLYKELVPFKLRSVPYLPKGYTKFGDSFVAVGLKDDKKLYLAVWNLGGDKQITLDLPEITAKSATVAYPKSLATDFELKDGALHLNFTENEQARLFEIEL